MCGIVGYVGNKKAEPIIVNGLYRLEYRGYDSAGIATIENDGLHVVKNKGRVNELDSKLNSQTLNGNIGIGHTRWATHGKPSEINSHPHMDNSHKFAVVHNGIIENYTNLKDYLISRNYKFVSDTDTEVIPNLIDDFYKSSKKKGIDRFLDATVNACKMLKGSYAIEVLCSDFPDEMIVVRKDSPLVIGKGNDENYISSDIPAILSFTKDFYLLDDNQFAVLTRNQVKFYNDDQKDIAKQSINITWDSGAAEKGGYADFMLKEIFEQPKAIRETIGARIDENLSVSVPEIDLSEKYLKSINKIQFVACGTAMHASMAVKQVYEMLCGIPVEVDAASEFRYRNPIVDEKTLCIFVTQSGETADTIAALKLAKSKGAKTIAITNVIGSSVSREADYTSYIHAGPEIAVASTKAYTSQIVLLEIIATYFADILGKNKELAEDLKKEIVKIPSKIDEVLKNAKEVQEFAKKIFKEEDIFFIGRGIDYTTALEGSLKLKEISYIHSEAYPSGELKHGPIALIEPGKTVVSILTNRLLLEKSESNIKEVITRGAKTFIVTNLNVDKSYDMVVKVPKTNSYISSVLAIVPLQLLAYYIAKEKGLDVDKPRNLAKSVTVE